MKRREFIALPGAALAAAMLGVRAAAAEQIHEVGWLFPGPARGVPPRIAAFQDGLHAGGFDSPDQVDVLARSADGNHARLASLARELIDRDVEVIAAFSPPAINAVIQAAHASNTKLPIVAMSLVSDPVHRGWVESLAHPGGNVTGLFLDFPDISKKWLQLLKEAVPDAAKIAVFWDPSTGTMQREGVEEAGRILKVELDMVVIRKRSELEAAFTSARARGAGATVMTASPIFGASMQLLADLALKHRLPAITPFPSFARLGGLMGYGPSLLGSHRQTGALVARVLRGRKPADLPVVRHSRFELVVNRKTAKVPDLTMPASALVRADQVIE